MSLNQMVAFAAIFVLMAPFAVRGGENAAKLYRDAVATLPHEQSDLDLYSRWSSATPMHQIAAETLSRCEASFDLLHRATAIDTCDWGWAAGAEAARSQELESLQNLARASALQIRSLFEQKRRGEAASLFGDLLLLGRRVAESQFPDARRAGWQIEHIACVVAGRYLPGLPHDVLDRLSRAAESVQDSKPIAGADDATATAQQVNRAERALFVAAVAIARDGRQALRRSKDPFGDGPFQYDIQVDGFLLRSKLKIAGAPVTLKCGPQAFE